MFKQKARPNIGSTTSKPFVSENVVKEYPQLESFPYTLNYYQVPPFEEINLTEFEIFALDRLRVLRSVETSKLRFKKPEDIQSYLRPVLAKYLELSLNNLVGMVGADVLYNQRRKDNISHFILRLAYCRSEDLRVWFVRQEVALFKLRFDMEQPDDKAAFLRDTRMDFAQTSFTDLIKEKLVSLGYEKQPPAAAIEEASLNLVSEIRSTYAPMADDATVRGLVFYRVPFEKVLDLVSRRSILLFNGWAFVPESERAVLMFNAFRDHLMESLEMTAKALPRMDEDDRLMPVLVSLSKQYLGNEYNLESKNAGEIGHEEIDGLVGHFPPCMRNLHMVLRRDAHLKHAGRLQYGLFLKGIGLSLDEAMIFWRKSFSRLSEDEFKKKNYVYNIRYNYGQEGKRTNYTPYSCMRIITGSQPGPGDAHGCPFKHFSADGLADTLRGMRVSEPGVVEIGTRAREGHYQLACTRLYELTRQTLHDKKETEEPCDIIEHPNQWFDMSYRGLSRAKKEDPMDVDSLDR